MTLMTLSLTTRLMTTSRQVVFRHLSRRRRLCTIHFHWVLGREIHEVTLIHVNLNAITSREPADAAARPVNGAETAIASMSMSMSLPNTTTAMSYAMMSVHTLCLQRVHKLPHRVIHGTPGTVVARTRQSQRVV